MPRKKKTLPTVALVDADSLVYAAASAAQLAYYVAGDEMFKSVVDAKEHCDLLGLSYDNIEEYFYPRPKWCARGALRSLIKKSKFLVTGESKQPLADLYVFVVSVEDTDGKTHRQHAYPDYKENRRDKKSPLWRKAMLRHMIEREGATYVPGWEADDVITTMAAHKLPASRVIIVHIDKDLDQIPGMHWDWKAEKAYMVTAHEAVRAVYHQTLTGDTVDNIQGLAGCGTSQADAILAEATTPEAMEEATLTEFAKTLGTNAGGKAYAKAKYLVTMRTDVPLEGAMVQPQPLERPLDSAPTSGEPFEHWAKAEVTAA